MSIVKLIKECKKHDDWCAYNFNYQLILKLYHGLFSDIGGVFTVVDYTISNNNAVEVHFNYLGNDSNFKMTRCQRKAFSTFGLPNNFEVWFF